MSTSKSSSISFQLITFIILLPSEIFPFKFFAYFIIKNWERLFDNITNHKQIVISNGKKKGWSLLGIKTIKRFNHNFKLSFFFSIFSLSLCRSLTRMILKMDSLKISHADKWLSSVVHNSLFLFINFLLPAIFY